ncbi:MAG: ATP-dependent helicase [Alistipes sp.]
MASDILAGLNPAQRAAVKAYDSNSLIIAGAGSGKTRVLTSRIAYMIEQGVEPSQILALTFTNKAADEMRERIASMVGSASRYISMGTFHSVFARILRTEAERIGFPSNYTIYDTTDAKSLIKTIVKERGLNDEKYKPSAIAARISIAKNGLVTPGAYVANSVFATEDRRAQMPEFGNIYLEYCRRCKQNGAMDFDDLLLQTNIMLRDCKDVCKKYQDRFRYILVDEYQDTNYAQYVIVRRLSQQGAKVCVVGDDAQSIYSFRGAKIENILSFRRDYPDAEVFKLEQNYRSTQTIVDAANSIIAHNAKQMKKRCFSEGEQGDKIRVFKAYTDREEAEIVVGDLREKVRDADAEWCDAAILYRTNNQSLVLEEALRRKGIPYKIYKGNSFYDYKEIRDMLGYIRLIVNPRDDEAFKRIINTPARGIGDTTVARIGEIARMRGVSMWEAVDTLVGEAPRDAVERAIVRKVGEFVDMIRALSLVREQQELYDFGMEVAVRSGLLPSYRKQNPPDTSAIDNIEELLNSMKEFSERIAAEIRAGEREEFEKATIDEWLQGVMLMTDMDNDDDADNRNKVTLMTVHSAKGLEYKYVYIVGCEENLFPLRQALDTIEGLEEERRLFYVALTRAKCAAVLSCAEMRFRWGNTEFTSPSRFLSEIDGRYVDADFDIKASSRRGAADDDDDGETALDRLRRKYDVRYQHKDKPSGEPRPVQDNRFGSRPQNMAGGASEHRQQPWQQSPALHNTGNMRRLDTAASETSSPSQPCGYVVGELVKHASFGQGYIEAIEPMATEYKLVVNFGAAGRRTLIARLAKLKKL